MAAQAQARSSKCKGRVQLNMPGGGAKQGKGGANCRALAGSRTCPSSQVELMSPNFLFILINLIIA